MRTYLGALDAGDAATFCGLMTDKYTKSAISDAVEHDIIRKGGNCADMVWEFPEAAQLDDVDSGDATFKEISNDGTQAAVKVSYEDPAHVEPPRRWCRSDASGRRRRHTCPPR